MTKKQRLNVDIPRAISDFEDIMKKFELKETLYRIIFRGKALEFEAYRNYVPDDDARAIDWKASQRANKLLVKEYREERDLDIFIVVDASDHMVFGSSEKLKCEYAAELVAALSHLIMNANDKVGLLMFSDRLVHFVEPSRGMHHHAMLVDLLTDPKNYGGGSHPDIPLRELLQYPKGLDAVIFVSDFVRLGTTLTRNFIALADRAEIVALIVKDMVDLQMPFVRGEIMLEDPTSKQQLLVNPVVARLPYGHVVLEHERSLNRIFKLANVDFVRLITKEYFALPLAKFLEERVRRRGAFL